MSNRFAVIIAGSRDFGDYELLKSKCDLLFRNKKPTHIISGGARGADLLGKQYAEEHNIPCRLIAAQWDVFGKRAGYLRNYEMLKEADALIAFWDGQSKGTKHMIDISEEKGIPVRIIKI